MNLPKKNLKRSGQVLMESVVALSLAIVGMTGAFALLSTSLSSNVFVTDQHIASNLASEGIEIVKNIIDRNTIRSSAWGTGITVGDKLGVSYNNYDDNNQILNNLDYSAVKIKFNSDSGYGYSAGTDTKYVRFIGISFFGASNDEIKVVSTVKWIGRGGTNFEVKLEDHFFNWRK